MKNYLVRGILLLLCISFTQSALAQEGNKKNLLFIITDQQRYDAIAYAGNTVIQTPNLDRLAEQGAYFTKAHTPLPHTTKALFSLIVNHSLE